MSEESRPLSDEERAELEELRAEKRRREQEERDRRDREELERLRAERDGARTEPLAEPHMPWLIFMSRLTRSIFMIISEPLPTSVAPRTGVVILPSFTRYPSITAKLNSPVAGLTEPPPILAAYRPSPIEAIISSGSSLPGAMKVLRMREVGA